MIKKFLVLIVKLIVGLIEMKENTMYIWQKGVIDDIIKVLRRIDEKKIEEVLQDFNRLQRQPIAVAIANYLKGVK